MSYTALDKKVVWLDLSPSIVGVLLKVKIITIIDTECSIYFHPAVRLDLTSHLLLRRSSPPPISGGVVRAPLLSPAVHLSLSGGTPLPVPDNKFHVNYKSVIYYD
jgi:hypothetical protein